MSCTVVMGLQAGHIAELCHRVLQMLCLMELLCLLSAQEMSCSKPITPPPLFCKALTTLPHGSPSNMLTLVPAVSRTHVT